MTTRSTMHYLRIGLLLLLACSCCEQSWAHPAGPYRPDLYQPSVWYSTGDMIYVYDAIPAESQATIDATFDCFKKYFNLNRIYWRDAQIEWYKTYSNYRPDSWLTDFYQYWGDHDQQNSATALAKSAAQSRGIGFWGIIGLFDISGGPATAQSLGGNGPYAYEDPLRQYDPDPSLYIGMIGGDNDQTMRYDATNRQLKYCLDPDNAAGIDGTNLGVCTGPDANDDGVRDVYVAGYYSANVVIYDGRTGAYLSQFVAPGAGGISRIMGITFGPDGNLYAASCLEGAVYRFNGATGAYMDQFVTGLSLPIGLVWGPDAHLYVATIGDDRIKVYNESGTLVRTLSGVQPVDPYGLAFGHDGKLYVASKGNNSVLRYDISTGTYVDAFVPSGKGGLSASHGLAFGPDVTGDGVGELYVSSFGNNKILRYNGATGAFFDVYVTTSLAPGGLAFSQVKYAATDRMGVRSNPGTLEYAYPEVRAEYVRRFNHMFDETNGAFRHYDGLQFYTYVENFCPRYDDECIYSEAVDREYFRRYGIDPRSDQVNLEDYNAIRGEYLTQYLRDIRPVFQAHNKKLSICLDASNPDAPCRWMCGGTPYILPTGRIKMEWRKWISEGLVDELTIWQGTDNELRATVPVVLAAIQGTPVKLSIHTDNLPVDLRYVLDQGVQLENEQMSAECGYPSTAPFNYTPVRADIGSTDDMKVLAVLYECVEVGLGRSSMTLPTAAQVTTKLSHSNPLIRRWAANALAYCRMSGAEAALRARLAIETETYVKAVIIKDLGMVSGQYSVGAICQAVSAEPVFPLMLAASDAFNAMPAARYADIADGYNWLSPAVRRSVVMSNIVQKDSASAFTLLQNAGLNDADWQVRFAAAKQLTAYPTEDGFNTLYAMLDDSSGAVSSCAALSVGGVIRTGEQIGLAANKLKNRFKEYGEGSQRADKDYGWNLVGYTLNQCGLTGAGYMQDILNDASRKDLGALAWQALYTNENGNWDPRTPAQVDDDYTHYPLAAQGYTITGTIGLKDLAAYAGARPMTIRIRQNGVEKGAQTFTTTGSGMFTIENVHPGAYDMVGESMPHWLRKAVSGVSIVNRDVMIAIPSLTNGDVTGDNLIDNADLRSLKNAFFTVPGNTKWNLNADLNGDGVVDNADLRILNKNFFRAGDQ